MKEDNKVQERDGTETEGQYITQENKDQDELEQNTADGSAESEAGGGETDQTAEQADQDSDASLTEEVDMEKVQAQIKELEEKLKEAEQKAEENYNRFLRAQADFENFRRRTRKEKEELEAYASVSLIEQLLPVLDNFERAIEAGKQTEDQEGMLKGVEMVFNQIKQVLQQQGLVEIEAVGQPFDPHVHEAVMQVESEEYQSGYVVEELQKGYKLKDRVIRPSMVKVSQ